MPARTNASRGRTAQQKPKLSAVSSPEAPEAPAAPVSGEPTPKPALTAVPSETPKAKPKPEPKPLATVDLGERQVTYFFPSITVTVDGKTETVACAHSRYGHEQEASARRCAAQLAAQHGHRVS